MVQIYNAMSTANGTYITCTSFIITTTASATATSNISQENAQQSADMIAKKCANTEARKIVKFRGESIVSVSHDIKSTSYNFPTVETDPTGETSPTGWQYRRWWV